MTDATAAWTSDNPFSSPSPLAYGAPAFDRIREEHFLPAFIAGMEQHLRGAQTLSKRLLLVGCGDKQVV